VTSSERVAELVQRYLDGHLEEPDRGELEAQLNRDAGARRTLVREMRLHAALRVHFGGIGGKETAASPAGPRPGEVASAEWETGREATSEGPASDRRPGSPEPSRWIRPWIAWGAATATLALLAALFWTALRPDSPPALARLERVSGQVRLLTGDPADGAPAVAGAELRPGHGLVTVGSASRTVVVYPDATRVEVEPDTTIRAFGLVGDGAQKRVVLARGSLKADVTPQPADQPMILATPLAQIDVLGTRLRLAADREDTRLEVYAGRARLTRRDGSNVLVGPGQQAAATAGATPAARILWEIGKADGRCAEFALAPNGFLRYRDGVSFTVSRSVARRDWPYVHPGPMDVWAGNCTHAFRIDFDVASASDIGTCRLWLGLFDVHELYPPWLRIDVNGASFELQVPSGTGLGVYGRPAQYNPFHLVVDFPAARLKPGNNRIEIVSLEGSWLLYDRIALEAPAGVALAASGAAGPPTSGEAGGPR
jgi:hypothetical protein